MAGEQYLKIAASNIQRAIMEKEKEIQQLHSDMDSKRNAIDQEISDMNSEIGRENTMSARSDKSDDERAYHLRRTQEIRGQIEKKRQEFNQVHDGISQQISDRQTQINDLKQQYTKFTTFNF